MTGPVSVSCYVLLVIFPAPCLTRECSGLHFLFRFAGAFLVVGGGKEWIFPAHASNWGGHCPIYPLGVSGRTAPVTSHPLVALFYEKQARRGARMRANESAPGAHRTRQKQEFAGFALSKAGGGGAKHSIVRRACGPAAFTCASQKFSAI